MTTCDIPHHDYDNRTAALLYIDGHVYQNETHRECLNDYRKQRGEPPVVGFNRCVIYDHIDELNPNIFFLHFVEAGTENDYPDGAIFVEANPFTTPGLCNAMLAGVRCRFPNTPIFDEDTRELLP